MLQFYFLVHVKSTISLLSSSNEIRKSLIIFNLKAGNVFLLFFLPSKVVDNVFLLVFFLFYYLNSCF